MIMDGGRVVDRKYIRAVDIGEAYLLHMEQKEEAKQHESEEARAAAEARANQKFLSIHSQQLDDNPGSQIVVPAFDGKPAVKFDDLLVMSPAEVTAVRKHATNYRRRNLKAAIETLTDITGPFFKGLLSPFVRQDEQE
jgi:hypothetical protein